MSFTLPFYRQDDQLPGPLPTQFEIRTAKKLVPDFGGSVVVVRDLYVVKYGTFLTDNEGFALLFIEDRLSIPAPRLHAMYWEGGRLYIVMDYISGKTLGKVWPSLSKANKSSLIDELHAIFAHIRSLPAPGFFGSIANGPVAHEYFYTQEGCREIEGPFENQAAFNKALALFASDVGNPWTAEFFLRHLHSSPLEGDKAVFTHGDLYRENILVKQVNDIAAAIPEYQIAAIIDWETAGWYPAYWEYAIIYPVFRWNDDWPAAVKAILSPWPEEALLLKFLHLKTRSYMVTVQDT
ncbi:hypothetical protein N7495_005302 [Penicillium taxi]|uniref:uncharacterized protein n=1 Tax=Penicillium taxi TaxID=168475 RepID=UPI0025455D14|nr:uncharacterized protein N7495_005302 [Penicillium taxi]KAJ5893611.1 hypothetical protein N7495_005302 [Penicillium taxi]